MKNKLHILNTVKVILLASVLTVGIQYVAAQTAPSWTAPVSSPPGGNTYAPINVGTSGQIKDGGLTLGYTLSEGQAALVVQNGSSIFNKMRVLSTGVGPTAINYIQSGADRTSGSWAPLYFGEYSNSNTKMVIDANGNVGIGANLTAPSQKLDVAGNVRIRGTGTAIAPGQVLTAVDSSGNAAWQTPAGSSGATLPSGSANQTLRYAGTSGWQSTSGLVNTGTTVGIGTTAPDATAKLHVSGPLKLNGISNAAPGTGKILTSDAQGFATWQENVAASSGGTTQVCGLVSGKKYLAMVYGTTKADNQDDQGYTLTATVNGASTSIQVVNHPDGSAPVTIPVVATANASGCLQVTAATNFQNNTAQGIAVAG